MKINQEKEKEFNIWVESILQVTSDFVRKYYEDKGYKIMAGGAMGDVNFPYLNNVTIELILNESDKVKPGDFSYLKFHEGKIYGVIITGLIQKIMKLPENFFPVNVVEMHKGFLIEQN